MKLKRNTLVAALGTTFLVAASAVSAQDITLSNGGTLDFYGFVKGDLIFDLDSDLGDTIGGLNTLNADSVDDESFTAHARQTRFGLRYNQATAAGEVKINIEGDFFGSGEGFRLRKATGELNGLLAGQTDSNFIPVESYPTTLDFQGSAGIPFERVAQLRYTTGLGDAGKFSTSIEQHANDDNGTNDPSFTAAYSYDGGNYFLKAAAIYTDNDGESTYGINLSGNAQLWRGGNIQAAYTTGEGIGSILQFNNADIDSAGNAIETDGYTLAISQAVTDQLTLGAVYGYREIDDPTTFGAGGDETAELETLHLNARYSPVDNVTYGIEYIIGERTDFDGNSFEADRVQASFTYSF